MRTGQLKAQAWRKTLQSLPINDAFSKIGPKTKRQDLAFFCNHFALLIRCGIPIFSALTILEEQTDDKTLRNSIVMVREEIRKGQTLADAMATCPQTFPTVFTEMIRAAELGGVLEEVLTYMARHFEKENELIKKVQSALIYPMILVTASVAVIVFVLIYIMPLFADMLSGLGAQLPAITSFLLDFSFFLQEHFISLLLLFLLMLLLFLLYPKSDAFLFKADKLLLHTPILGPLLLKVLLARFCRTLGTLLASGLPLLQALEVLRNTLGNKVIVKTIDDTVEAIHRGDGFAGPLEQAGYLPSSLTNMVSVGEETGSLDVLLIQLSDFYDKECMQQSERLSTLLEPLLMVFMGTMVTFLVFSMLLPMFEVIDVIVP
ncbi:type II secretion system F family protein [Heliorestis convoluta]|uniref:Type II secretion system (T2SS), F family protein n=1 Tax=Heliorestis convoluta TaxID=356322 RepID=A0A5Q2N537_9FIRM|nr:type II secretion system F family protein [Heliorestis convoluta]QGG49053.1 type II secretion system (T2SS), F family protein [Heliorestis convoluta]